MSRTSKQCLKEKNIFKQHLEDIQDFLNPSPVDRSIEAFISETEEYESNLSLCSHSWATTSSKYSHWARNDRLPKQRISKSRIA